MSMVQEAIKEVLQNNSRVIIPEIGAIIMDDDAKGNIFFSEYIKFDDDTILDELVKTNNMSKSEAKNQIESYTSDIKKSLDSNRSFEVEGLGFIQIDNHGKTVFNKSKGQYDEYDSNDNLSMEETPITNTPEQSQDATSDNSETFEFSNDQTTVNDNGFENQDQGTHMAEDNTEFEELSQVDHADADYGLDFGDNEYQEIQRDEQDENLHEEEDPYEEPIEEQRTPEAYEAPEPPQKATSNKSTVALIVAILLISGVSGWYFFLNGGQFLKDLSPNQSSTAHTETTNTEPNVEVVATSLDNNEETANTEEATQEEEVNAIEDDPAPNEEPAATNVAQEPNEETTQYSEPRNHGLQHRN